MQPLLATGNIQYPLLCEHLQSSCLQHYLLTVAMSLSMTGTFDFFSAERWKRTILILDNSEKVKKLYFVVCLQPMPQTYYTEG